MVFAVSLLLALTGQNLPPEVKRLFDWYDNLGDNKYLSKPFIGVKSTFSRPMWPLEDTGFLIREDAKSFDILNVDHGVIRYSKVDSPTTHAHFEIIPLKFSEVVVNKLAFGRDDKKTADEDQKAGKRRLTLQGSDFGAAWLCYKFGLYAESREIIEPRRMLYESTKKENPKDHSGYNDFFLSGQRASVGRVEHRAIDLFEDLSLTWAGILAKFEELAIKFKETQLGPDLAAIRDQLKVMIAEDKVHIPKNGTQEEKTDELIWRLRDDSGWRKQDSADQLIRIGMPAVPQLINALDDKHLTRSIFHHQKGPFSYNTSRDIYTVGYGAHQIIERIANRQFWGQSDDELKANVKKWFADTQNFGEKEMLSKAVRKGDQNSPAQAAALIKIYPAAAFEAIKEGYGMTRFEHVRAQLVEELAGLPGTDTTNFLKQVAKEDTNFDCRVNAIVILLDRDQAAGIALAQKEWSSLGAKEPFGFGVRNLVGKLYNTGNPDAVKVLGIGLREKSVSIRFEVVFGYDGAITRELFRTRNPNTIFRTDAFIRSVESLFATELDDSDVWEGGFGHGNVQVSKPKMSTVAVFALANMIPAVYQFINYKSDVDIERQRKETYIKYLARQIISSQ